MGRGTQRQWRGGPLRRAVTPALSSMSRGSISRSGRRARDGFHGAQRWLWPRVCLRSSPISTGPGFGFGKPFRVGGGRGFSRVGTEGSCPSPHREGSWPEAAACFFPLRQARGEGVTVAAVYTLWAWALGWGFPEAYEESTLVASALQWDSHTSVTQMVQERPAGEPIRCRTHVPKWGESGPLLTRSPLPASFMASTWWGEAVCLTEFRTPMRIDLYVCAVCGRPRRGGPGGREAGPEAPPCACAAACPQPGPVSTSGLRFRVCGVGMCSRHPCHRAAWGAQDASHALHGRPPEDNRPLSLWLSSGK